MNRFQVPTFVNFFNDIFTQIFATDKDNIAYFKKNDLVYAGRPPTFQVEVGNAQYKARIMQVLPKAGRLPVRYLLKFMQPDVRTKKNEEVVIPHYNRHSRTIIFPAESEGNSGPSSPIQMPSTLRLVQERELENDELVLPPESAVAFSPIPLSEDEPSPSPSTPPVTTTITIVICKETGIPLPVVTKRSGVPLVHEPQSKKQKRVGKLVNTPTYATLNGDLFRNKCLNQGEKYILRISNLCKFLKGPTIGGYFNPKTLLCLSTAVSRLFSNYANQYKWGVESKLWSSRSIYFANNLETDGLQWARQIKAVFPIDAERLNWAQQYRLRTKSLKGDSRKSMFRGGQKVKCYHRPRCVQCGIKTKTYHVLWNQYECVQCINVAVNRNRLVTHTQASRLGLGVVTETLLRIVCH